jgi:glycosyltransferase involved in cell wall biosynthesis
MRKILWVGNTPWSPTGYGTQARAFFPLLKQAGWTVFNQANYGLQGAPLNTANAVILPRGMDDWGNDVLPMHYEQIKPDVVWLMCDIWVMQQEVLRQVAATAYSPVDHEPVPPAVLAGLAAARWQVAFSNHGEREMRKAGLDPFYVPHAIDTEVFVPSDRQQARQKWSVDPDTFFVSVVAANKGNPSRKSLDRIIKAWGMFLQAHPDTPALLYMHTMPFDWHAGYNLPDMMGIYGVPRTALRFPATYPFLMGQYTQQALNDLYNASDVMLLPSMGEGFGIPAVEAQASGCPVIVSDFSAQAELGEVGYKIPIDDVDGRIWTYQASEQAHIAPTQIVEALEWAFEHRNNSHLRHEAREFAVQYDSRRVFNRYMRPVLDFMAEVNRAEHPTFYDVAQDTPQMTQEVV